MIRIVWVWVNSETGNKGKSKEWRSEFFLDEEKDCVLLALWENG